MANSGTIGGFEGVFNMNTIGSISNLSHGDISGAEFGISNIGTIGSLNNAGLIAGGGFAIFSPGSIGPITNTGQINGTVEIDDQARVVVRGGLRKFGSWTGGVISIGNGNLTFATGETALSDNIVVYGTNAVAGAGTVFNHGSLMIGAPETITGNFTQSATGALDFGLAGDMTGQYGSLAVTGLAGLKGGLGLDLANGFALAAGESFDLMSYAGFSGDFYRLSVDGAACSARLGDVWFCTNVGLNLDGARAALRLTVASGAAASPARAIPEPSTWTILAMGFLGLAGVGIKRRRNPAAMADSSNRRGNRRRPLASKGSATDA